MPDKSSKYLNLTQVTRLLDISRQEVIKLIGQRVLDGSASRGGYSRITAESVQRYQVSRNDNGT